MTESKPNYDEQPATPDNPAFGVHVLDVVVNAETIAKALHDAAHIGAAYFGEGAQFVIDRTDASPMRTPDGAVRSFLVEASLTLVEPAPTAE